MPNLIALLTTPEAIYLATTLLYIFLIALPVLGAMAYLTWAERKVLGWMHLRHGPMHVGWFGLLQPIADAVKLMFKEPFVPGNASKIVFLLAPVMVFVPSLIAWAVMPFGPNPFTGEHMILADINLGVLYLLAVSSLSVYGILMAGWSSNSKYPFLGAVRSGAQMVSYEVSMGLIILSVILLAGSMNLNKIILAQQTVWFIIPAFPAFVMFVISILAECNRAPFDLPEAEAELVAGYNVEYGSMPFALFFLGEYIAMITMSAFTAILFLGGWLPPLDIMPFTLIPGFIWFILKIGVILFIMLWARATLPRFRYDQLMRLGWKIFLPASLIWLILTATAVKLLGNFGV
ncbi:MAG: NADH-quinone oxidoreductase subunit NuoH [Alphaproteobacteria bacterium CG_4_10_14_0_8_um_filter_53_9]|nr:MAG: NADH-quinone oxidoreductase subunit NuoH [Alphaproteobacteria bacterium CG_4_10_14_0_8_um_filter_53_9]